MATQAGNLHDADISKTLHLLQEILSDYHPRNFAIQLGDGTVWPAEPGQFHRFTWRINNDDSLQAAIRSGTQAALGEAYICGDFDIEGDIEAVFPLADYLLNKSWTLKEKLQLATSFLSFTSVKHKKPVNGARGHLHSKERDLQSVSYHYDVSNQFYQLWLDKNMVYSCAYFEHPQQDLDAAQIDKLDYICRKLRLKPDERLLDIGCGWGGLLIYAAKNFGVRASGITLSQHQYEFVNRRIEEEGLLDQCDVRLLDYRDLNGSDTYDKLVSVGMAEHVGEANLPDYFHHAFRILKPGGFFLNHAIGRAGSRPRSDQPTFTDVHVFPDGELIPISQMLSLAEKAGFEVRDVENLREHYTLTLNRWLRRLEDRRREARLIVGEEKYRIWRLYLAGSAYYFKTARLDLYQTVLVKNHEGSSGMPLRRSDWYD